MNDKKPQTPMPETCAITIFEMSGVSFDPDIAADLWLKILNHKWLLSEKVGRDMGMRTACIDFFENMAQAPDEHKAYKRKNILKEMGVQK